MIYNIYFAFVVNTFIMLQTIMLR